ncbi:MAG: hypothetical protein ACTMH4_09310 [Sphingobacterium sp.]
MLTKDTAAQVLTLSSQDPIFTIHLYFPNRPVTRLENRTPKTFHIDIDQLATAPKKTLLRLLTLLGKGQVIYARQTVVARIDKKVALDFQIDHHLQLALAGKYRYGLFSDGELISIAVFSGGRHMRDKKASYRSFELLRFCHKSGVRVVGGLSKLTSAFIKSFKPNDIMTYVDRDWARVSNLHTIGFRERGQTLPQQFWIASGHRHHAPNEVSLAELQNSFPDGYLIYNSGSTKLILELP